MRELRVLGPPGTGKTTRLAHDIGVAATRYGPERVLVASYSRAAAQELVSRDLAIPPDHVGTLHALCYRALDRPVIADKQIKAWNETAGRYALSGGSPPSEADSGGGRGEERQGGDTAFAEYNRLRALMTPRARWPHDVTAFAQRWEAWKAATGYLDFTDLIETALHTLPEPPFPIDAGFFDEAQDFSALETALIRQWGRHMRSFVMVGDDDQVLYSFRGASPEGLLSDLPPDQVRVLAQSYRVPRAVHAWATRWIRQLRRRNEKAYAPRDADGAVRHTGAHYRDPEALLREAQRHLDAGRTVMVLASAAYLLDPFLTLCRTQGVTYHNPYKRADDDGHRWNPLTPARGAGVAQRLLAYLRPDPATWGAEARDWTVQDLRLWVDLLRADGVLRRGAKGLIDKLTGADVLSFDQLSSYFEDEALAEAWTCSLDWLDAHTLPARRTRSYQFAVTVARRHGPERLRETPRLIVGTGHSVKGGEADVVIALPDVSQAAMTEWCAPGEGHDAIVRLVYVMATRARAELVLCEPGGPRAVEW